MQILLTIIRTYIFLLAPLILAEDNTVNIHFRNGDHLRGTIQDWNPSGITLSSEVLEKPILIDSKSIGSLSIIPRKREQEKNYLHETLLSIKPRFFRQNESSSADLLRGQLTGISEKHISLSTWYAGTLNIERSMIASVDVYGKGKQTYYGPNSLEEWNQLSHEPGWTFKNGTLSSESKGHIAKHIDMSNSSVLSFDYSWIGNPDMRILLFSDDPQQENPRNCYELTLSSNYTKLTKIYKHRKISILQMRRAPQLRGSGSTHVDFYADATNGSFALFLDGQRIFVDQDRTPAPDSMGGGLHLISENSPLTRIRNLQVSRWSGDIPKSHSLPSIESLQGEGEKILLRNGDAIVGTIKSIDDETIQLQTEHTPIEFPLERMRSLDLRNKKNNAPLMKANDILARFQTGGWVILDLHSITPTTITGYNQAFGTATFQLDAFSSIEFHIYEDALALGADEF